MFSKGRKAPRFRAPLQARAKLDLLIMRVAVSRLVLLTCVDLMLKLNIGLEERVSYVHLSLCVAPGRGSSEREPVLVLLDVAWAM